MDGATRTDRARPTASRPEPRLPMWAPLYHQVLDLIGLACAADFKQNHGKGAQQRYQFTHEALRKGNEQGLRICLRKLHDLLQPQVDAGLGRALAGEQRFRVLTLYHCLRALKATALADATRELELAHECWAVFRAKTKG